MKIVSACLAGRKCRWDGTARPCQKIMDLVKKGEAVPVCPEQLGGLTTPHDPAERKNGGVFMKNGKDVTAEFKKGAQKALEIAQSLNCKEAILKSKSPFCGCGKIYDGTFSGKLVDGDGVFTKLLKENGVKVFTENQIQ